MQKKIKTINITAKEWFDEVNGNSYFSACITINYGLSDRQNICVPFQYGCGSHYQEVAFNELLKNGLIAKAKGYQLLWSYCKDNNIILRTSKHYNCKKRDVIQFGIE